MFFKENLAILRKKKTTLYEKIINFKEVDSLKYEILMSKSNYPTLKVSSYNQKFYLHSKYNPIIEARRFIDEFYEDNVCTYIIYGFGFGYHIKELIEKNKNVKIYVLEANKDIFKLALQYIDLTSVFNNSNVDIFLIDSINDFNKNFKQLFNIENKKFIIHLPSLYAMPKEFEEIKYILENYRVKVNTANRFASKLKQNFEYNILKYDKNIDLLFNKFNNMPIVIVSAGPSLDKNKHLLKEVKGKAIILSVGTSVKPLINSGIHPDLIIITDPTDIVYNQLANLDINIPIIVLSTCNYQVMQKYKGTKLLALQQGFKLSEHYAKRNNNQLVETGGSVSTTALDIAIKFGCNPIIFVGLDLSYSDNKTHVKGTYFYREIQNTDNLRPIPGNTQDIVYTSKNLHIYLKWIEERIRLEKSIKFINATGGGAFIKGTYNMSLNEVIKTKLSNLSNLSYDIDTMIKRLLNQK